MSLAPTLPASPPGLPSPEPAKAALQKSGVHYEPYLYDGAGHGFLRAQSQREGANLKAAQMSWPRTIAFLKKHL